MIRHDRRRRAAAVARAAPLAAGPALGAACALAALLAATVIVRPAAAEPRRALRFEDVTATHLPETALRNSMDVGVADLDGDGDLDVAIPQERRLNTLSLNGGDGRPDIWVGQLKGGSPDETMRDRLLLNRSGA